MVRWGLNLRARSSRSQCKECGGSTVSVCEQCGRTINERRRRKIQHAVQYPTGPTNERPRWVSSILPSASLSATFRRNRAATRSTGSRSSSSRLRVDPRLARLDEPRETDVTPNVAHSIADNFRDTVHRSLPAKGSSGASNGAFLPRLASASSFDVGRVTLRRSHRLRQDAPA